MQSLALALGFVSAALASDYYVDSNGSDVVGLGTQQSPWRTLEHAFATIDQCDADIWLTADQTHEFDTLHWNSQLPPMLGGWDECDGGGTWQIAGLDGVADLTSNSPFPFDISKSSNPGWPVIDPEVRNTLILRDLNFEAGPNVVALAIPAAGDFRAVNLTTDIGLTFGYGGNDAATQNRTIEIIDSQISAPVGFRPFRARYAAMVSIQNSSITGSSAGLYLEAAIGELEIEDSTVTACPNSRVIDGTSPLFPYAGCSISVINSTMTGNGFLAVAGLRPVIELDNVQCCNCSQGCVLNQCQVIGSEQITCCGVEIGLDSMEQFAACLNGPGGGISPGCECLDVVPDFDVDLRDFAALQRDLADS